jgi:hypothetical protein
MPEGRWSFGCLSTLAWLFLGSLVTIVGLVAIALTGSQSESMGVTATYVMALPLGAAWSAMVAAVVLYLFTETGKHKKLHIGAPVGCGCLGALCLPLLVWIFFTGIWPSL